VDKQAGFRPFDRDAVARPHPRLEVHVALVLFWRLLARDREAEIGVRAVLRGVVAADLVVGAAVGRPQVDVLELAVLKTEGDANKAACAAGGAAGGTPGQFHRDCAIVKDSVLHDRVGFTVGHLAVFRDLDCPLALIVNRLQFHLVGNQLTNSLSGRRRSEDDEGPEQKHRAGAERGEQDSRRGHDTS
jgi:hypothetical protein